MRRLSLLIGVLVLLTACGGKQAGGNIPTTRGRITPSAGELEGLASYYAEPYHGRRTASGEIFDSYKEMTAAHRTLPFNTIVRVTNTKNGKQVDVRINDRGPFIEGRVIDPSAAAARKIGPMRSGTAPVRLMVI